MSYELINLFIDLCKIDSPTGEEKEISDFIFNYLKKLNIFVKKDSFGNLYIRFGVKPKFFLSAHLDTVEPGKGIKPQIRGDYVVSDYTTILGADNKAAIAAILKAVREIIEKRLILSFEIIFTLSEEIGNYGAINFDYSLLKSRIGFCFDASDSLGTIITASPFYERFDLKIIGQEAHASKPEEAKNVIYPLVEVFQRQKLGKIDNDTLFNIGVINSGQVRNTIPGEVILKGEIRSFFEKKLIKTKNEFINTLFKIQKKYQIKIEKEFVRENPGYFHKSKKAKENLKKIKIILNNLKLPVKEKNIWGVSDANIFNEKGLLCFNLADGTEYTHSKKERIKIQNLLKLKEIIKNIILYW